jgi:ABC-type uncharacterized transport system substrate-binding protein
MRRREVLSLLGGALVSWPHLANSQCIDRLHKIGVLIPLAETDPDVPPRIASFEQGLRELGWFKERNILIHYRFAAQSDQLKVYARELAGLQPDLIVAGTGLVVQALLREVGTTVPIVFVTMVDPVGIGFVRTLQRPGGNMTGFTWPLPSLGGKWLQLLKEIAPNIVRVGIMSNPDMAYRSTSYFIQAIEAAAASNAVQPFVLSVRSPGEIEAVFAELGPTEGLVVIPDTFIARHRALVIEHAARFKVPAIYFARHYAVEGGLMSCGVDWLDHYRRTPSYVDYILRGRKPADLPVQVLTKIELVINLRAAEALGLSVPRLLIARANEVIG